MDKIIMAHGAGGKTGSELMARVFAKHFSNDILDKMEDGAVLSVNGRIAYTTDSFIVTPLRFPGGDIGKLSVCGTVNDLLMMGAEPAYIACGFILEEGLDIGLLEELVASMAEQARIAGVKIVAGDTKVIENRGSEPGLFINTSGIGMIPEGRDVSAANCRVGDAVLLSGTLGDHQATIFSARMRIENGIRSDCGWLGGITGALFANGVCVRTMRDVTRGGLGTILNEIAENSGISMELSESSIPVSDEVRGFADILGLDPLYMANEGKMIAVVKGEDADRALAAMRRTEKGADARIIGHVIARGDDTPPVFLRTRLGGTRVIDMLYGEGLPRIC